MKNLIKEFNALTVMRLFEIEVIDTKTNEKDYIIFNISINEQNKTFVAQHVALTKKEDESKFIAFKSIEIDDCFSLDEHLQNLFNECNEAILNSDFYKLPE